MRPSDDIIMREAHRLHDQRFSERLTQLKLRAEERFNQTNVQVPAAYAKTAQQHSSNIIDDEGRQITTLIYADPVPHLPPPDPMFQALTTKVEQVLTAALRELEDRNGPVNWQCAAAQTHDNLGWIFTAPKKLPYKGQPDPQSKDFDAENDAYKKEAGICSVIDYEFVNTATVLYDGNVYDPHCVYVWKQVPASTLRKTYGVYMDDEGKFTKRQEPQGNPTGYESNDGKTETLVTVVEYWDRTDCVILAESTGESWMPGGGSRQETVELAAWTHNWGRVPYFARPAFVTEQLDEDKKYAGPLDGIYNEMPNHKRLRTMADAVAYQTAFAPLIIETEPDQSLIMDDSGQSVVHLEFEPGKARQLGPGQKVAALPQSPEVAILFQELAASQARIERFTLSPVSKGISPGADTANAALSNLHRFQLSTLDPMAEQASRQYRTIFKFWLRNWLDETVYVLDRKTDQYLALAKSEIPSTNIDVKVTPDQGQQQLLIEKHATELWQARAISKIDMYAMMGYENPEEKAMAVEVEDFAQTLKPIVWQQVTSLLGLTDAIKRMVQENAQSGDASNAIPGIMQDAQNMQEGGQSSGMGQGAPGQPRWPGTRMDTLDVNTQQQQAVGSGY